MLVNGYIDVSYTFLINTCHIPIVKNTHNADVYKNIDTCNIDRHILI